MSYESLREQLSDIEIALSEGNFEEVDAALDRLNQAYNSVRPNERRRVARLQVAREVSDLSSEQYDVVNEYQRRSVATYMARSGILVAGDMYLHDPEGVDATEFRKKVDELHERERSLADATDDAAALAVDVDLPPRLAILEFAAADRSPPLGETVQVEIVAENVGDEPVTGIEASVVAPAVDTEWRETVSSLDPAGTVRLSFGPRCQRR